MYNESCVNSRVVMLRCFLARRTYIVSCHILCLLLWDLSATSSFDLVARPMAEKWWRCQKWGWVASSGISEICNWRINRHLSCKVAFFVLTSGSGSGLFCQLCNYTCGKLSWHRLPESWTQLRPESVSRSRAPPIRRIDSNSTCVCVKGD